MSSLALWLVDTVVGAAGKQAYTHLRALSVQPVSPPLALFLPSPATWYIGHLTAGIVLAKKSRRCSCCRPLQIR